MFKNRKLVKDKCSVCGKDYEYILQNYHNNTIPYCSVGCRKKAIYDRQKARKLLKEIK